MTISATDEYLKDLLETNRKNTRLLFRLEVSCKYLLEDIRKEITHSANTQRSGLATLQQRVINILSLFSIVEAAAPCKGVQTDDEEARRICYRKEPAARLCTHEPEYVHDADICSLHDDNATPEQQQPSAIASAVPSAAGADSIGNGSLASPTAHSLSSSSSEVCTPPMVTANVTTYIQKKLRSRDRYWHKRAADELEAQKHILEATVKKDIGRHFAEIHFDDQTNLHNALEDLQKERVLAGQLSKEFDLLKEKVQSLEQELSAGHAMISQFSEIMHEASVSVCRYCRRSGTLPPRN